MSAASSKMSMQPGDHVRPHGGRRVHKLGDLAPTDSCPTKAICGAMMWSDGHVTDRPVTCQKCIRHQALAEMVDIALEHDLYEATPDTTPCPDCEWTDAQDLWEPEAHRVLAHPCPKHTHTEEDQ